MSDFDDDDDMEPLDRINAMESEASEPKWPIYVGVVALIGFLGAFAYVQFGDGVGEDDASLIPSPTVTPTERPSGDDLFGDVDFRLEVPVEEPTPEPVEDPRIAELAQLVADLQAQLAEGQQTVEQIEQPVADTSELEARIEELLRSQSTLQSQLREMEMRLQAQTSRTPAPAPAPVVETIVEPEPEIDTAALEEEQRRREALEAARLAEAERLAAPAVIFSGGADQASDNGSGGAGSSGFLETSNNAEVETAFANSLSAPSRLVPQGTMIAAVLETSIDSDLPGLIRARVTYDIWGYDGTEILIPRGSTLIGEYDSDVSLGASRVQVAWNRIITTDNQSIMIGSRGADGLGRAGLTGDVNQNFALKFEAAFFVSVLSRIAGGGSTDPSVQAGIETLNATGTSVLDEYLSIPPTIAVQQGTQINVFVARDLVF